MIADRSATYKWIPPIIISIPLYYLFAYTPDRTQIVFLLSIYAVLFGLYLWLYTYGKHQFAQLVSAGILFRLLFLFVPPNLSQDFYRFLWDGELMLLGIDPYLQTPEVLLEEVSHQIPLARELHRGMGALSASHYSNYPPLNQMFFALSAFAGGQTLMGKVLVLKVTMLLADLMTLWFGMRILKLLKLPQAWILLYFLNPFAIIELSGNLHFEGVMMGFFTGGLYYLFKKKYGLSALLIAAAISVKLIPLIFLPLLYMHYTDGRWFPERRKLFGGLAFTGGILALVIMSFIPFTSFSNMDHFTASVNLWFSRFEFNASLYYLAREVGFLIKGYNVIGSIAPWIPVITVATVGTLCFNKRNGEPKQLITSMLLAISVYLFISTTVHPWYLVTPLMLSVLLNKKYAIAWTCLVMLSYVAYANTGYKELPLLLWVEYGITYALFFREMVWKRPIRAF